jgi:DNA processing protein
VAVLGCGVDVVYPPEHRTLRNDLVRSGAVISEFPMGTEPDAPHFPRRNRIISGMTPGTLIIEAGKKSGALLTAAYALEQNREVFAVPGSIMSLRSQGTNALIKRGAKLVSEVEDILEELSGPFRSPIPPREGPRPIPPGLSPEEEALVNALSSEPRHIDDISEELGRSPSEVLTSLLSLELSDLVRQLPGKVFVRV